MTGRCCRAGGIVHPDKVALLERLDAEGVPLPDDARVFGPLAGPWRVVDRHGRRTYAVGPAGVAVTARAARLTVVASVTGTPVITPEV